MISILTASIQNKEPCLGLEFSVRKCLFRSLQKIRLWTKLRCNSYVRASVRLSQRIQCIIVDSTCELEESGSWVRSRVRFMCSIRGTDEIGLQLEFGSACDVRVSARISVRFKVK